MASTQPRCEKKNLFKVFFDWFLRRPESGIILILLIFVTIATCVNPTFLSPRNVVNILRASGFTMISVVGMSMILVIGGLDLSIGSIFALSSIVTCISITQWGLPVPVGIVIGLAVGAVCGLLNGFLVVKTAIPPMIVTLGMQYALRGTVSVITKGVPIYPLPESFTALEPAKLAGIPLIVIIAVLIAVVGHIALSRTYFGRSVYAIGGNQEAARISGVNINRTKLLVYVLMGILVSFAGIMTASRLGSAEPSTGTGLEMKVICGAIIGGISISGGMGTMLGAALGAVFMEALTNSLTVMRISVYWQNVVFGVVMILSVLLDQYKRALIRRQSIRNTELKRSAASAGN
ncbi:MAG: ABC transporter permease [Eubacteriales bacterium]|nr:ABC transporter permease [Eubacteriales bacterium]